MHIMYVYTCIYIYVYIWYTPSMYVQSYIYMCVCVLVHVRLMNTFHQQSLHPLLPRLWSLAEPEHMLLSGLLGTGWVSGLGLRV